MAAQLIRDRVEMECLEGAWETLEGNTRCRFRGTIRFTATSLVHPDEPARTLQRTVEWTAPWISFVYFWGWVYLGLTVRFTLLFLYGYTWCIGIWWLYTCGWSHHYEHLCSGWHYVFCKTPIFWTALNDECIYDQSCYSKGKHLQIYL